MFRLRNTKYNLHAYHHHGFVVSVSYLLFNRLNRSIIDVNHFFSLGMVTFFMIGLKNVSQPSLLLLFRVWRQTLAVQSLYSYCSLQKITKAKT